MVEAKKAGTTLSGFAEQSEKYLTQLPEHLDAWADPLPFGYESTGIETLFRDLRDPKPRSRPVFAFHKPETLAEWLAQARDASPPPATDAAADHRRACAAARSRRSRTSSARSPPTTRAR